MININEHLRLKDLPKRKEYSHVFSIHTSKEFYNFLADDF